MFIGREDAQHIVDEMKASIHWDINIMDGEGAILASTNPTRQGKLHQGALRIIREGLPELTIWEDDPEAGVQRGINLPIVLDGQLAGVIGVTGDPAEVSVFGDIIKRMTEIMVESIRQHVDFAVGFRPQVITFVYVADVVHAVFLALDHGRVGGSYFLTDGGEYSSRTFSDLVWEELGRPWLLRLKAPVWLLRIITCCGEYAGRLTGKVTALNNDKFHILKQRNWRCDIRPAREELGYEPQVSLAEGVKRTVAWWKQENHHES